MLGQLFSWFAAFVVVCAVEFLCLSAAKLMVLDRMMQFAMPKGDGVSRRWVVGGRVVMSAVVAGNVVRLGGNVATAVYNNISALPSISVQHLPRSPSTTQPMATHIFVLGYWP